MNAQITYIPKCQDCSLLWKDECPELQNFKSGALTPEDHPESLGCKKFTPRGVRAFYLGDYTFQVKGDLVLVYEGTEPVYPLKLDSLAGAFNRKSLAKSLGLNQDDVDKLAAQILVDREGKKKTEVKEKEEGAEFNEETKAKARELLCDPAFFYKLGKVFEYGFMVPKINKPRFILAEERNKRLLGFLLIGASKLDMTSIIKILGLPGTAKDTEIRMWLQLLPIKSIERSYITAASLRYSEEMKDSDLLYVPDSPELRGEMGRHMRFMRADDGGLISEYAMKDSETGEMTTKTVTIPVKGVATTSNAITGDAALESGMWTLHTNGSELLTRKVKEEKLKLHAGKRPLFPEDELPIWRCAFKILMEEDLPETLPKVPFAENLIFLLESERSESRRDPDKLCDLISLIAWARRFQKSPDSRGEADLSDLYYALQIGLDAISQTISELDEKEQQIYKAVATVVGSATCRYVADKTKIPYKTSYSYLEKLVEKGFMTKDKEGGRNIYFVLSEKTPKTLLISEGRSLEKPDELMKFILGSFKDFSPSRGDHNSSGCYLIDPISGEKVVLERVGEGFNVKLEEATPENKYYPYPPEKVRSSQRGKEQVSEDEKEPKNLLPSKIRSSLGVCYVCGQPILKDQPSTKVSGVPCHTTCLKEGGK